VRDGAGCSARLLFHLAQRIRASQPRSRPRRPLRSSARAEAASLGRGPRSAPSAAKDGETLVQVYVAQLPAVAVVLANEGAAVMGPGRSYSSSRHDHLEAERQALSWQLRTVSPHVEVPLGQATHSPRSSHLAGHIDEPGRFVALFRSSPPSGFPCSGAHLIGWVPDGHCGVSFRRTPQIGHAPRTDCR
jgi:hypothetical protein